MLIRHPWLAELMKPPTINEDAEAEAEAEAEDKVTKAVENLSLESRSSSETVGERGPDTADREVAAWVLDALEKKRLGKVKGAEKPALHAAPLDAVPGSPENKANVAAG